MNPVIEKKATDLADRLLASRVVYGIDPFTLITIIIMVITKLIELWRMFHLSEERGLAIAQNPGIVGRMLINRVIRRNGGRLSDFSTDEIRKKLSEIARETTLDEFKVMTQA